MIPPADHPQLATGRVGVLVVNLGTPDAPTPAAVKTYLRQFLSDRRVVELPPIAWQPLLRGIVLNTRPKKSARLYASVWDKEANDSPLRVNTRAQAEALAAVLPQVDVAWAMRYGEPAIAPALYDLHTRGCERILIAPLYPQYCAATTATANDAAFAAMAQLRWQPAIRTLPPYGDDPAYVAAIAAAIETGVAALDFAPDVVLASFHGMPLRTLKRGDPYHCHCRKTVRLVRARLGWPEERLRIAFQSRFGAGEWLRPYTDETLAALPAEGARRIALIAPGFSADCLETLEELAIRGRETFLEAGGTHFAYLPCLNATPPGIALLRSLIANELAGWVDLKQQEARAAA